MNAKSPNEATLLEQALAFGSAEARQAFLQGACGGDEALLARVQALIEAHEAAGGFLAENETVAGTTLRMDGALDEGPGTVVGRYKLLQQIGEGGMGIVYMAEQTTPVIRKVALKVIKLGMDTRQVVARFEAERQALALMDHPNIAKVLDAGATDNGRPYFVMELVRGIPITEYCDKNHLPARQRLELFIPVCQAIQHAHQKGIIHRDIKPSNVLVTLHDGRPLPMVIDFGVAKAIHQRLTEKTLFTDFAQMIGTPAYMSPEQAEMSKLDVDTRTDVYALGVLLYELLTGTTPFTGKELMAAGYGGMQRMIAEQEPPRPSTRLSTMQQAQRTVVAQNRRMEPSALARLFQGDLDWIVMKCLEKERGRRYETANGLALDIEHHLKNELVTARPPSTAYRLQKAIRRNRLAFAAASAVVLVLVVGLAATTWQTLRATKAEREQTRLREGADAAAAKENAARRAAEVAQAEEKHQRERAEMGERSTKQLLYAANLNLIPQAWQEGNVALMRKLLTEIEGSPHLGFEWYYWQHRSHGEILALCGHTARVSSVAYSPDGQRIVTGGWDGTARVWDTANGRELLVIRQNNGQFVHAVAYSPDAQRILTGGSDGTARLWESATGRELLTFKGDDGQVVFVAFSPDGQRIVTGSNKNARIWATASGQQLLTLSNGSRLARAEFSPDGLRILTFGFDGLAGIWDATTGEEIHRERVTGEFSSLSQNGVPTFSSTGGLVLVRGSERKGKDQELTGDTGLLTIGRDDCPVSIAKFSPDARRVATAGGGGNAVSIWDVASKRELTVLKGHSSSVFDLAFSPDGQRVVTAGMDGTAKLWDAVNKAETVVLPEHGARVGLAAFSPDGKRVLVTYKGMVVVSESETGKELVAIQRDKQDRGPAVFSPDGLRIVESTMMVDEGESALVPSGQQVVRIWDVLTGEAVKTLQRQGAAVCSIAMSPDGRQVLAGALDGTVRIWDVSSGRALRTLFGHTQDVASVGYSADGRRMVTAGVEGTVRVWETSSGKQIALLTGNVASVWSVSLSGDGLQVLVGGVDGTVLLWEAATGKKLLTLRGHAGGVDSVSFGPDQRRIITASSKDGTLRFWEVANGKELLKLKSRNVAAVHLSTNRQQLRVIEDDSQEPSQSSATQPGTGKVPVIRSYDAATPEQVARWREQHREAEVRLAAARRVGPKTTNVTNRAAGVPDHLIDLSAYYNASTREDWHNPSDVGNNLASLPLGVQEAGGVRFDVRGIVQLNSACIGAFRNDYPDTVPGIRIGQVAAKLHFLHGTGWDVIIAGYGSDKLEDGEPGVEIARYVIHYVDGGTIEVPIRYGEDVRTWQFSPESESSERGGAQPVWKGPQQRWQEDWPKWGVRLFLKTWENPRPDVRIESLDFLSTVTCSAPFVLAITADLLAPPASNSAR